jgi:probable HAF family extracellular repeat protein
LQSESGRRLRRGYSGGPISTNDFGAAVGFAQNGEIDPLLGTPELRAALWKNGEVIDLGTLGGNGASSNAINNRGQIFGGALNTIPDADPFFPFFVPGATQVHAVLWENGSIRDLGTLGGTDSVAHQANDLGQAMGISFTDSTVHTSTGLPTTHPFLWEQGRMHDVGSLGGSFSQGFGVNSRGEVVGFSLLEGDEIEHPFLWRRGALHDLGTLGGDNGEAWWINSLNQVVGRADLTGSQSHHAFLWRNHEMKDLGAPHGNACSTGEMINRLGQVVGDSGECGVGGDPFLWEKGHIVAIRDLIIPGSRRFVFDAFDINDRGEIVSLCATPEGHVHVCILVPEGEASSHSGADSSLQNVSPISPGNYPKTGERRTPMHLWQHSSQSTGGSRRR